MHHSCRWKKEKYAPKPQKHGLVKIEFVPQGGNVPDRKKANETMVSQREDKWEVAADVKGCERFFPIPTTKKPRPVIWNEEDKEVHLVELTVPHEDNISLAHDVCLLVGCLTSQQQASVSQGRDLLRQVYELPH